MDDDGDYEYRFGKNDNYDRFNLKPIYRPALHLFGLAALMWGVLIIIILIAMWLQNI
jgi:hypothetical protein